MNWKSLNIPPPIQTYALYHYGCQCQKCSWFTDSDKDMFWPERDYYHHFLKNHTDFKADFVDPWIA